MDNYFTSFRLLTHVGVNNIRATSVLKKIGLANALSLGTNSCKKRNLRDLFGVGTKLKKIYSRTKTKSVLLLQPEYGFFQQNGLEPGQDWYPNEKMVVVLVCLNGRCCYSGCVGIVSY